MLSCYIIDDELHAVELLSEYISQTSGLQLIGHSIDAIKGLRELNQFIPQLLFLDIDMPKMSGLDLSAMVNEKTNIVFTTAHASYAVEAFNLDAADFLLKPIRYHRFLKSIEKITEKATLKQNPLKTGYDSVFLQSSAKGKMIRLRLEDILYVESLNNYLMVTTAAERHILYLPLKELMEQLPHAMFFRIHKSFVVNYQKIRAIEGNRVFITGMPEIPIGPQYREELFAKVNKELLKKKVI